MLVDALAGRKAPLKALLLEQSVVAGLGNLYADEALYLSGIHPERAGNTLSEDETARLHDAIVTALTRSTEAYTAARDAQWPDPPTALSPPGRYPGTKAQLARSAARKVQLLRVRNRSTWYCPACQPAV